MSTMKKLLLSVLVVGAATSIVSVGTFATFTAETTNSGNTFATGTLVLSDKVGAGTACLSTAGSTTDTNANGSCTAAFNLTTKKPGDSDTSGHLTIFNDGSLDPSAFKVYASGACASADDTESYHGTGTPCSVVDFYLQETAADFTTAATNGCFYGGGTATTCAFDDTKTLGTFGTSVTSGAPITLTGGLNH